MKKISIILIISIILSLGTAALAQSQFADITSHWAKDYIEQLTGIGAIKGRGDGLFHPEDTITRAEFIAILLRSIGNDVGQPDSGKWYELIIKEAEDKGYIVAGEFDSVESNITRGEMARMITRALDESYPDNVDKYTSQIADYKDIPNEYKDYILKAFAKGIITGRPGGVFAYSDTATRAEASTMIVRLIDTDKRIIPELEKNEDTNDNGSGNTTDKLVIDGKEVVTSHPEIIPHIKKGMEIMSKQGYVTFKYYPDGNQVYFTLYANKEDSEGYIWEAKPILLRYYFYTERDHDYEPERIFYAYNLALEAPENKMARDMFLEIV